jgi:hypothetical protein
MAEVDRIAANVPRVSATAFPIDGEPRSFAEEMREFLEFAESKGNPERHKTTVAVIVLARSPGDAETTANSFLSVLAALESPDLVTVSPFVVPRKA